MNARSSPAPGSIGGRPGLTASGEPIRYAVEHRGSRNHRGAGRGYAPTTARSVISSALSMMANASRSSASVTVSGGLVKNVCQRTKV